MTTTKDRDALSDEARLRQALADMNSDPSSAHDDAVLTRARAVADEISAARGAARGRSPDWTRTLGLAAAVAVAVIGLSWLLPGGDRNASDSLRGAADAAVYPEPGASVASAPAELRWSAQPGAQHYRVTLRDASAAVVWQSAETAHPRVELGPAPELTAGGTYFWTVSVAGAAAGELGPFMFRIAEP
jgi:hypothetical protein